MIRTAPLVLLAAVIGCTIHHVHRVELVVVDVAPDATPEPTATPTPEPAPRVVVIAPTPEPSPTSTTPTPTPVSVLDAIEEKVERLREAVEP